MVRFRLDCGSGGTGRRAGLRILWPQGRGGSTPSFRTSRSKEERLSRAIVVSRGTRIEVTGMDRSLRGVVNLYNPADPLERAWTIPAPWYLDARIAELERQGVFGATWQFVGRTDQVREKGQFFTVEVSGEPLVVVRGQDGELRAFFNVC